RGPDHLKTFPESESRFVQERRCQRGGVVQSKDFWAYDGLRREIPRPRVRQAQKIITVEPFVAVIESDLIACVEMVIDLLFDLFGVGIKGRARGESLVRGVVSAANPLVNSRVETISRVENVCMRHRREKLLSYAGGIHTRAVHIPGTTGQNSV